MGRLVNLVRDARGATAVEYGLIVALIVIAMVASFSQMASVSGGLWQDVQAKVESA
jgi:pilus assembly protein Flp/PilA